MICPACREEIDSGLLIMHYHKLGREATCPRCQRKILFMHVVDHPQRERPKRMSKKERLRIRRER